MALKNETWRDSFLREEIATKRVVHGQVLTEGSESGIEGDSPSEMNEKQC